MRRVEPGAGARAEAGARRSTESEVYDDGTNTFFWRAHTLTVLFILTCALGYVTLLEETPQDTAYNTKRGVVASILVFLCFGVTQAKDGPFSRPHPAYWRFWLCVSVVYELFLIFILFQSVVCPAAKAAMWQRPVPQMAPDTQSLKGPAPQPRPGPPPGAAEQLAPGHGTHSRPGS